MATPSRSKAAWLRSITAARKRKAKSKSKTPSIPTARPKIDTTVEDSPNSEIENEDSFNTEESFNTDNSTINQVESAVETDINNEESFNADNSVEHEDSYSTGTETDIEESYNTDNSVENEESFNTDNSVEHEDSYNTDTEIDEYGAPVLTTEPTWTAAGALIQETIGEFGPNVTGLAADSLANLWSGGPARRRRDR